MALTESTELTHLALNLYQGRLTAIRVKTAFVVARDGVELMRQETDEQALPDGADLAVLVGEALAGALAAHVALTVELQSEQARAMDLEAKLATEQNDRSNDNAKSDAVIEQMRGEILRLEVELLKVTA